MAGWQDAPIVGGPPAATPAWQSAPVVAQQTPAVAPVAEAQPRPYVHGHQLAPTDAEMAAQPAADPYHIPSLVGEAMDKGLVADTLGAPVDLATLGVNGASYIANMLGKLLGNQNDITPYAHDVPGGSDSIASAGGQAFKTITGHDLAAPETPAEKLLYNATETGTSAAGIEAGSPWIKMLGRMFKPEEIAAPTADTSVKIFRNVEPPHTPTPASVTSAAAAGAGAGAAHTGYEEYAPDSVKQMPVVGPGLDLLSQLLGAVGGHALGAAGKVGVNLATQPVRWAADRAFGGEAKNAAYTLQDGTTATNKDIDAAAKIAQDTATNPAEAARKIATSANEFAGHGTTMPTAGAMSEDPGLVGLEQNLRLDPKLKPGFIENDRRVQQAALDRAKEIAPLGAMGRTFTDVANSNQADKVATARAAEAGTQTQLDALGPQRAADAGAVTSARQRLEPSKIAVDKTVVNDTLRPMQEASAAHYNAVDPERTAQVATDPMIEAATAVRNSLGTLNDPSKVIPAGLLRRIEGTAGEVTPETTVDTGLLGANGKPITRTTPETAEPSTTSIGDITAVYPELANTEVRARKAGNFTLADNIRTLRTSMDGVVAEAAAAGDPAAQRLLDAKQNYAQTVGATFNGGPGDEAQAFRKDYNLDRNGRSTTPPSATADRFLKPGQPEKAAALDRIISASDDPAAGRQAVGHYLMADLADSGVIDTQGHLNADAMAAWRTKWGSALNDYPDFVRRIDALQSNAAGDAQEAARLTAELRTRQTAVADAERNDTAFQHVVGKSPTNAVQSIFASDDPEAAVKEIMATIGKGTAAHDGLKAAVREYLVENATTSALQKTSTGANPLSFAKLDTLFKQHESTLAEVFTPDEMAKLQAAHKFLGSLKNLEMQSLAGSATAERAGGWQGRMMQLLEIGLKTLHGGLKGGNEMRNIKLAAAMRGAGPDAVSKLLAEMQFNPELAGKLLGRDVPKKGSSQFDRAIFNWGVQGASTERNDEETKKQAVKITVNGGK